MKLSKIIFGVSIIASFLMLVATVIAIVIHDYGYSFVMFALFVVSILQNVSVYKIIFKSKSEIESTVTS
ncbi:hypothetical protein ACWE42_23140 [Sutcliffiella cohnii]|uniref:hypothetical protein n=1 Tax=Sutcliffiella TaxID=2837511 RepID=UPI0022DE427E|nr:MULTISPECIES: hypothetical protein [Sutcliffiella]MED4017468.1 hypothetical protein [Sutcliffiella cohnii]WBL16070.1 hypothetical protein O1A01_05395 [Sutcliffiella sp. NC1]